MPGLRRLLGRTPEAPKQPKTAAPPAGRRDVAKPKPRPLRFRKPRPCVADAGGLRKPGLGTCRRGRCGPEPKERRPAGWDHAGRAPDPPRGADAWADSRSAQTGRGPRTHFRFAQSGTVHNPSPVNRLPTSVQAKTCQRPVGRPRRLRKLLTRIPQVSDHLQVPGRRARLWPLAPPVFNGLYRRWNARHRLMPDGNSSSDPRGVFTFPVECQTQADA